MTKHAIMTILFCIFFFQFVAASREGKHMILNGVQRRMSSREDVGGHDKNNAFWIFLQSLELAACPKIVYALLLALNILVPAKLFVVDARNR
ncbi:hypothetical protein LINPERHAP1_LOCUS25096 [Linum perenne]